MSPRILLLEENGYGGSETNHNISQRRYAALKVYICSAGAEQECNVLRHLESLKSSHPGKAKVRTMLDAFTADGPSGRHQCLVHEPLLTSISHLQASLPNQRLTEQVLKLLLKELLVTLDYLHTEAQVINTGGVIITIISSPPGCQLTICKISNRRTS